MRRYAKFMASLIQLNVEYGDGQLELNLDRLQMAVDELLVKLSKTFAKPKLQINSVPHKQLQYDYCCVKSENQMFCECSLFSLMNSFKFWSCMLLASVHFYNCFSEILFPGKWVQKLGRRRCILKIC
ncbi:uncharacterized protein LOC131251917 [Magnolia sinica]|uniref:uncharacterized protein LOC131251917 n=1 Tax=Magnolia sinica TaxID=86752 RepID=UPI00265B2D48|nr:uncharacterized protein LOC131251917 [Magnolia sinica]